MKRQKRAALYLRVSTDEQTTENQRLALSQVAEQRGWDVAAVYDDAGLSGGLGRDQRPDLDKLLKDAAKGKFDVVLVWALDRLGRSLADLISTLEELETCRVDLLIQQSAIDTTTPAGKCFYHVMGAFAQFEREQIKQRIHAGIVRAKEQGTKTGNPFGRPKVPEEVEVAVRAELAGGKGILKVAKEIGVGTGTVQRIAREMRAAA